MRKKNVIVVMLILLAVMAIGYGAFSTTLTINGTANISSSWEVVFTEIKQLSKTDGVTITTAPQASGTTATFDVDLTSPGDAIEYQIKVENKGSIDAKIESITATETGSDAIVFEIIDIKEGQTLLKQATKTFKVKISYKDSITSQPNITTNKLMVSINFVQLVGSSTEGEAPTIVTEKLAARILKDNIAYADNVRSPYVNSDTGIDFSQVASAENGQGLYYTNKNTDGGKTTYYFRGDVDNNYIQIGEDVYGETGYCVAGGYEYYIGESDVVEEGVTQEECEAITDACIYTLPVQLSRGSDCDDLVDWHGSEVIDYVDMVWYSKRELVSEAPRFRIVRINEDGSVRLMSTSSVNAKLSVDWEDVQSYRAEYKKVLQAWYEDSQISNYSSNLISDNFCYDDLAGSTEDYYGDYVEWQDATPHTKVHNYSAYDRLVNNKTPKLGCSVTKNGGYVDLITADEVMYAGGVFRENITGYLSSFETGWHVGTPMDRTEIIVSGNGDMPKVTWFYVGGIILFADGVNNWGELFYPVINVKGDVKILEGNGTSGSPYKLQMN